MTGQRRPERAAADAGGHDDSFCGSYKRCEKKLKVFVALSVPKTHNKVPGIGPPEFYVSELEQAGEAELSKYVEPLAALYQYFFRSTINHTTFH